MTRTVVSLEDLKPFASELRKYVDEYRIILFYGDMGTGKTTLIKLLCETYGVQDAMSSPTFSIVNEYLDENDDSIFHFDLYRLESLKEAIDIGIEDYLFNGDLCLIEWPQIIVDDLLDKYLKINIKLVDGIKREITISKHD